MGTSVFALAALEVPVRCRSAAIVRVEDVRIHSQTHGASGVTPLKSSLDEDLVQPFRFGLQFHQAGPGDDAAPEVPGGVRFYTVDWAAPALKSVGGLALTARSATEANANILVDLEADDERPVVVSLTYAASSSGVIQEWDGEAYQALADLPATIDENGALRWMRTTFRLKPSIRFDYQPGVVGANVLLQTTALIDLHRIEATPL